MMVRLGWNVLMGTFMIGTFQEVTTSIQKGVWQIKGLTLVIYRMSAKDVQTRFLELVRSRRNAR